MERIIKTTGSISPAWRMEPFGETQFNAISRLVRTFKVVSGKLSGPFRDVRTRVQPRVQPPSIVPHVKLSGLIRTVWIFFSRFDFFLLFLSYETQYRGITCCYTKEILYSASDQCLNLILESKIYFLFFY